MKATGKLFLQDVPLQHAFQLSDGSVCLNLQQLAGAISRMSPEVFAQYVNESKNDFLNWIRYSVQDLTLAEKLIEAQSQDEIVRVIRGRIAELAVERKAPRRSARKKTETAT